MLVLGNGGLGTVPGPPFFFYTGPGPEPKRIIKRGDGSN